MRMSEVGCTPKFLKGGKVFPHLLSNVTVGVQPTSAPTGIYFALRYIYQNIQPNYNPWQLSASYDIASMYPNVIDKSQFNVKLPKLKYKREYVWHR